MRKTKKPEQPGSSSRSYKKKKQIMEESELEESDTSMDPREESSEDEQTEDIMQRIASEEDEYFSDDGIPTWEKGRRLSSFPSKYREYMYYKKIDSSSQSRGKLLICEREVVESDFRRFGIFDYFERLGWGGCLDFNFESKDVYVNEIFTWMATLEKRDGERPPVTTQLVGKVNGVEVVLNLSLIKKWLKVDMKRSGYVYPTHAELTVKKVDGERWETMINELFVVPQGTRIASWQLMRDALKAMPRLLLGIVTSNIMPRQSDRNKVRYSDVLILYALITGSPQLSLGHVILHCLWEAHEKPDRLQVPYARLLTKMLSKTQKAIPKGTHGITATHIPFAIRNVVRASCWTYTKTDREYVLAIPEFNRSVRCNRSDVEDEPEDSNRATQNLSPPPPIQTQVQGPYLMGFTEGMHETPYYQHIYSAVDTARPGTFSTWPESAQMMYDRQSQDMEQRRMHERAAIHQMENYRNQDFEYHERIRHENDYQRGWEYTVRPEPYDWTSPQLEPYEMTNQLPRYPQSTPSEWINPYSQPQSQQPGESSSADPFNTRALTESLFDSVFGSRYQPPPYDG